MCNIKKTNKKTDTIVNIQIIYFISITINNDYLGKKLKILIPLYNYYNIEDKK